MPLLFAVLKVGNQVQEILSTRVHLQYLYIWVTFSLLKVLKTFIGSWFAIKVTSLTSSKAGPCKPVNWEGFVSTVSVKSTLVLKSD